MPTLQNDTDRHWSSKDDFESQVAAGTWLNRNNNFKCPDISYRRKYPKPRGKI